MVLNGIVGAAGEEAGYGGPTVAELGVGRQDGPVLLRGKGQMGHIWAELVAPP